MTSNEESDFMQSIRGLKIPPIKKGEPIGVLALVKISEPDGGVGWVVRTSEGLDDEEVLGVLTGYVKFLLDDAASMWEE